VSDSPNNLQINSIALGSYKYFVTTTYNFAISSVSNAFVTLIRGTNMGVKISFPSAYKDIWSQIAVPNMLNITINGQLYQSTNVTLTPLNLFASLSPTAFTAQISFTSIQVSFAFRNPNSSIDCSSSSAYTISLFDFKGNSIFAQTLSNNKICPALDNRLYSISVAGNTKISAGSS